MNVEYLVFGGIIALLVFLSVFVHVPEIPSSSNLSVIGPAPEFQGITSWINSEPLTMQELRGKVVLIDFWTYSCINCIRTLPYLKEWHEKYSDQGLVIIGVHTPEFEFEKDRNNVITAVENYGLKYAVAQDNGYTTWRAYRNNYWPRKYLVDSEGNIRYDHIGEGAYAETENAIQSLLRELNPSLTAQITNVSANRDFSQIGTPELYLGFNFARAPLGNREGFSPGNVVDYQGEEITNANIVYLEGKWRNEAEFSSSVENSKLFLVYKAKNVNIVAGGQSELIILLDGAPIPSNSLGTDTVNIDGNTVVAISEQKLYNIVSTPDYNTHLLEIRASPGFELYTFTFG